VDRRADLWAFGAVLYEMLTGHRAFGGDDVPDTLAHILTKEPDWERLPSDTPASIHRVLRRCLEKDRKRRLDSAGAVRLEIDEASGTSSVAHAAGGGSTRRAMAWGAAMAVVVAALTFGVTRALHAPGPQEPAATTRFAILLPPSQRMPSVLLDRDLALSPDGRTLVFRVGGSTSGGPLALRDLDALDARLLPGIDNARAPFFSPDGRWVGFFAGSEARGGLDLRKISTSGGLPLTIASNFTVGSTGHWVEDERIVVADLDGRIRQVSAAGGALTELVAAAPTTQTGFSHSSVLSGGRGVLQTVSPFGTWFTDATDAEVVLLDLHTGARTPLVRGTAPNYLPVSADAGYLVYASAGTLYAARLDLDTRAIVGDPLPLVEGVAMAPGGAVNYDVSRNGTLVYAPSGAAVARSLVWVDRSGRETPTGLPARAYTLLRLSPDGTRVALTGLEDRRIWIGDLRQGTVRRLTLGSSEDGWPIWTPDGRSVVFNSDRDGAITMYSQPADGSGPAVRLTTGTKSQFPNSMAPDGRHMLAAEYSTTTHLDVAVFAATGAALTAGPVPLPDAPAMPFVQARALVGTPAIEYNAIVSPDGRFFAYQSNESGRNEVYVKPFPMASDVRWQVSSSGGSSPVWSPKAQELYYRDISNAVVAVPFEASGAIWRGGTPAKVIDAKYAAPSDMFNYDLSPDGQRFLMFKDRDESGTGGNLIVVLNWGEEVRRRVGQP
jgi:serine/threonine-protein kinase